MSRRRKILVAGAVVLVLLAVAAMVGGEGGSGTNTTSAGTTGRLPGDNNQQASAAGAGSAGGGGAGPLSAEGLQARAAQRALWRGRLARTEQVYASYRDATRYPPESRPMAEHPDQVRPFDPITEDLRLKGDKGEFAKGVRLRTSQERVFVSGTESVAFTIRAVDDNNQPLTLTVRGASAQTVPDSRTPVKIIQSPVAFADSGTGADAVAGDGIYSARLSPGTQGFDNYSGTIRLIAEVTVASQPGFAQFDVIYTPEVPAVWLGARDALEAGSLNFYLKLHVRHAGRYVVSGRVDDANGVPFALVQFNDELALGARELRLQVFGALVRDKSPAFPLRLRDVDGFLLMPDIFPDRSMMARQPGLVHASARYTLAQFSAAEWTSEERERYLAEYGKDAEEARKKLAELGGG